MNLLATLILGGLAGWIGSMLMHTDESQGIVLNVIVGVVGAFVGSYIFGLMGGAGVSGLNLYSLAVSVVGSVVFIWVLKMIRG